MKTLALALALTAPGPTAIVGGGPASPYQIPYIVSLQYSGKGHYCGGTLVGRHWVLTAAHCVTEDGDPDLLLLGLYDRRWEQSAQQFRVRHSYVHPLYDKATSHDYDFALIQLDHDAYANPIQLNTDPRITETRGWAFAAGWGSLSEYDHSQSPTLLGVWLPLVPQATCSAAHPGLITQSMLCAGYPQGGADTCAGDSGGPLAVRTPQGDRLVGVISWGNGCARPGYYGIYGSVAAAASWIQQTMSAH